MGNMEIYRLELLLLLLIVLNQTFQTGIQGVIGFVSETLRFQFYHKTDNYVVRQLLLLLSLLRKGSFKNVLNEQ